MLTDTLAKAILDLEEEQVIVLVKERLAKGDSPLDIVESLQKGMSEVGKLFETGEFFLSELVMCGEIMKDAMDVLEPHLIDSHSGNKGNIVVGTVKGDIHDLGKNIVVMLLKGAGYNVIDLGVDVPIEKFVEAAKESKAPLVGMSVLLTGCQEAMKQTIDAIRAEGLNTKVIIGGNYIDELVREYVGADYFANNASDGLKVAKQIFS
ncbi:MAG: 5-methyltetrahydrofolate--homocysteine methyltransferase [Clostridiaceae bacterium BRH_c20a]|nr:MAG: 5-methyltetrahydrofolate--homocysteine methyltransferase [Clostridiaceae bacterium BRH_c20a]